MVPAICYYEVLRELENLQVQTLNTKRIASVRTLGAKRLQDGNKSLFSLYPAPQ